MSIGPMASFPPAGNGSDNDKARGGSETNGGLEPR